MRTSSKRLGDDLESAITQARRGIHGNDVERLKQLLTNNRRCCRGTATVVPKLDAPKPTK